MQIEMSGGGSRNFSHVFFKKYKLYNLTKIEIHILTKKTHTHTQIYKIYNCLL